MMFGRLFFIGWLAMCHHRITKCITSHIIFIDTH
ncbi:hypothetical protein ANCCAN_26967 [Ancylostoma caninum]|uniref:Uncharacterized protein n=1 Tax=Ancylostoma caninum TaxID=29170 RepID=A0A368F8C2_ANCCA|nr:hypothetical protein ANCCAN_26967 [Ancylostoma caninum]